MTASTLPAPRLPGAAALTATVWLILAIAAGATGFFLRLPFPGPQLIILGLVVLTLVAGLVPSRLRTWIDAIPLRVLVGVNATRFIGIAFLVLAAQGQMNQTFADRAGGATSRPRSWRPRSSSRGRRSRRRGGSCIMPGTRSASSTSWSRSARPRR